MSARKHSQTAQPDARASAGPGRLAALVTFALCLALFTWRAAPGVTFEDSGELAAATVTTGVPHPPGYPLQMLVGRAWWSVLSPFVPDPARALNLFSATCAAGAAALLALFVARASGAVGAAIAAGLLLALAPTFAAQAVITEVYALAALLQALLLVGALTFRRPLVPCAFVFGLALTAHQGSLLFAPLLVVAFLREPRATPGQRPRGVAHAAVAVALGLTPYLYVPLAALGDPVINWGEPTTLARLGEHLFRTQYALGIEQALEPRAAFLAEQLAGQWPLAFAASAVALVVGRRHVARRALAFVVLTLLVTALGLLVSVQFAVEELAARWRLAGSYAPLVLLTSAACGLALAGVERALRPRLAGAATAVLVPLAAVALAWPVGPTTLATAVDQRDAVWAEAYAREVLEACPPDAALVVNKQGYSDVLYFPLLYLQVARGVRPDVFLLNRDLLPAAWFREQLSRRHPELAPACARLSALFEARPELTGDPKSRRLLTATFFADFYAVVGRPVVFPTPPGVRLLHGRQVVPGPVLWHLVPAGPTPAVSDAPRASSWLPAPDPERGDRDPWLAALRGYARERDLARARLLRAAGNAAAAAALER